MADGKTFYSPQAVRYGAIFGLYIIFGLLLQQVQLASPLSNRLLMFTNIASLLSGVYVLGWAFVHRITVTPHGYEAKGRGIGRRFYRWEEIGEVIFVNKIPKHADPQNNPMPIIPRDLFRNKAFRRAIIENAPAGHALVEACLT